MMMTLEINKKKVEVQDNSTIMDAANKLGIYIPHFCYHEKLSLAANCRMCLVDVKTAPKLLPACATPVTAGMIINTVSEEVFSAQKSVMEFLLINHPLDCPICDKGGECQLQDIAVGYGSSFSRYTEEKRIVSPKDLGPLISAQEMNRCIHCTRCIRFGQEIAGIMELGMVGRGEHSEISTFIGQTVNSELSGNMIDLCPVGALTSKPFRYNARSWELSQRKSISPHDSLGANLIIQVKDNQVVRVLPLNNESINQCWISDKERFSYDALNSTERLSAPMLKKNNTWYQVEWQVALEYVANNLNDSVTRHGGNAIAAIGTCYSTLEELSLLQKLMRGIGSDNIDFRLRQSNFVLDNFIKPWLGMSISDFSNLDYIFVIGSFLRKDHPVLTSRLRLAVKQGAKISILHAVDEDLLMPITHKIIKAPSKWPMILNEIVSTIAKINNTPPPCALNTINVSLESQQIAMNLLASKSAAIFLGNAVSQHPNLSNLHAYAQWIAKNSHAKFGYLMEGCNTAGGYLANAIPGKNGKNALQILTQSHKAYILLNAEPELESYNPQIARATLDQSEMVVVMSAYKHALDYAHVLLPITPFTETHGTFVNCEGVAQSFNNVVRPFKEARPAWKVLRMLGNLLNVPNFDYETSEAIRDEILGDQVFLQQRLNNFCNIMPNINNAINLNTLERIADVPIYFTDPIARRSVTLLQTLDGQPPKVWLSSTLAKQLKIINGDFVTIRQGLGHATLISNIDNTLPKNVVRIATAHISTIRLGGMFDEITVEKT